LVQNPNVRIRLTPLFLQDFQDPGDGFTDIVLELIYRFTLGVAAREGRNLSPKAAVSVLMDDNGAILRVAIFLQKGRRGFDSEIPVRPHSDGLSASPASAGRRSEPGVLSNRSPGRATLTVSCRQP
jgi:hypothetical protein